MKVDDSKLKGQKTDMNSGEGEITRVYYQPSCPVPHSVEILMPIFIHLPYLKYLHHDKELSDSNNAALKIGS